MVAQVRLRDASGTLRTAVRIRVRDENRDLRTIQRIRVRDASNVLRTVWQAFSADVTPEATTGYYDGGSAADIATGSVVALPNGGTAPFTYAWVQIGSSPYAWLIGSPAAATTNFTGQSIPVGVAAEAQFQVTITDAGGATAQAIVTAAAINETPYYQPPTREIDRR